ncbi:Dabb family protein [Nocardia speluncae]|uniref:Dabb family protein n=1 Tax=Nocardia speluncae TaxID=419477 RepID=A0A846XAA9_9NOCA|nr:Dabb family protein [Nocardia speluncae]NKY31586.1 Dabb family protein [Nocardia speluncae]
MYKVTRLLHLADPADAMTTAMTVKRITAAAEAVGVRAPLVAPTLPEVRNGGDLLAHFRFASKSEWLSHRETVDEAMGGPAIEHIDSAEYPGGYAGDGRSGRRGDAGPSTVYRTLFLRVDDAAAPAEIARFEHATLQMPRLIPAIRAWQFSRVDRAAGTSPWTHVWEQEYADIDGLLGPYMNHPVHWALVDQWFDPESPNQIVKDRICHSFCAIPAPVIHPAPELTSTTEEAPRVSGAGRPGP